MEQLYDAFCASGNTAGLNPAMTAGKVDLEEVKSQLSSVVSQSRLMLMPQINSGLDILPVNINTWSPSPLKLKYAFGLLNVEVMPVTVPVLAVRPRLQLMVTCVPQYKTEVLVH